MKRLTIILAAAAMLTGCSNKKPEIETVENSTPATTAAETTMQVTETETSAETTTTETTTHTTTITEAVTETKTHTTTVTEAVTETATLNEDDENMLHTRHIEKVPLAEQAAFDKLRAKYGKDFTFVCRDVKWEFWGEIPEKKPTTYTFKDDEGRSFLAYGTEDSDEINSETYAFLLHKNELFDHVRDYIRSYTQAGKLWILSAYNDAMPFETPAEMTYEEFFSYFCGQESKIFADILLPEGTELPEELTSFDWMNSIYLDDFGCRISLGVYFLPQSDYDKLEDVVYGNIDIDRNHLKGANE